MSNRLPLVERPEITELIDRHVARSVEVHEALKARFWADPQREDSLLINDAISAIGNLQMDVDYLRGTIRDYEEYLSKREAIQAELAL